MNDNKLLEKIFDLTEKGYEVVFRPPVACRGIEIRLIRIENGKLYTAAQIIEGCEAQLIASGNLCVFKLEMLEEQFARLYASEIP